MWPLRGPPGTHSSMLYWIFTQIKPTLCQNNFSKKIKSGKALGRTNTTCAHKYYVGPRMLLMRTNTTCAHECSSVNYFSQTLISKYFHKWIGIYHVFSHHINLHFPCLLGNQLVKFSILISYAFTCTLHLFICIRIYFNYILFRYMCQVS